METNYDEDVHVGEITFTRIEDSESVAIRCCGHGDDCICD